MTQARRILVVGTYPPTQCGLATFTANLRDALAGAEPGATVSVIRLVADRAEALTNPPEVVATWPRNDRAGLRESLAACDDADVVLVQHEFGIFGGPDGGDVLALAAACPAPIVTVLHTVLDRPTQNQRRIIEELAAGSAALVVQTEAARSRLVQTYDVDESSVMVIAHGARLNLAPTQVPTGPARILTWGLLGPGKGIEHGVRALSLLVARGVDAHYVVAGDTHPVVRANHGESYREMLRELATQLGVADRLEFDTGYRDWGPLHALVRSTDVVLLPYDSTNQVTSGVLVEAIASGKPVVATQFPHAVELLAQGSGITVKHRDPVAIADALATILTDASVLDGMANTAAEQALDHSWPVIGDRYRSLVSSLSRAHVAA